VRSVAGKVSQMSGRLRGPAAHLRRRCVGFQSKLRNLCATTGKGVGRLLSNTHSSRKSSGTDSEIVDLSRGHFLKITFWKLGYPEKLRSVFPKLPGHFPAKPNQLWVSVFYRDVNSNRLFQNGSKLEPKDKTQSAHFASRIRSNWRGKAGLKIKPCDPTFAGNAGFAGGTQRKCHLCLSPQKNKPTPFATSPRALPRPAAGSTQGRLEITLTARVPPEPTTEKHSHRICRVRHANLHFGWR
jgi:hypothetical protein